MKSVSVNQKQKEPPPHTPLVKSNYYRRMDHDLSLLLKQAESGQPRAARALIVYFVETVRAGKTVKRPVLRHVAQALDRGLSTSGTAKAASAAWKALGLTHGRAGNPGTPNHFRRLTDVGRKELKKEATRLLNRGNSQNFIKRLLAPKYGVSEDTVRGVVRAIRRGGGEE